jgi:hypothetical protein
MLSFMREQGGEGQGKGAGQREGVSPDGGEAQEYLTVATTGKSLRNSTILVAILVAIGLGGLGYMIRQSQPTAALGQTSDDERDQIEKAITRLTTGSSETVTRTNEIVDKFYEFSDVFQVGVSELVKNPFEVEVVPSEIKDEVAMAQDDAAKAALIRREKIKKRAETLKLLSVLRSEDSDACMINDQILHVGEMIDGFEVTKIGGASVLLTWRGDGAGQSVGTDDLTILLKLAQ